MIANLPFSRFLLVEDNPLDTVITTRVLQKMELVAQIDTAKNGQAALDYLSARSKTDQYPEVILLDIDMPVMDGFAFLVQGFATGLLGDKKTRVIILTSSINPFDQ
jgi:CheY-like chemotaxis protein